MVCLVWCSHVIGHNKLRCDWSITELEDLKRAVYKLVSVLSWRS